MQPGSLERISDNKLVSFAVGQQKKSRFQKAREDKELKKKEEEREAAAVYETFVKSFSDTSSSSKAFVRGSTDGKASAYKQELFQDATTVVSRPSKSKGSELDRLMHEMIEMDTDKNKKLSSYSAHASSRRDEPTAQPHRQQATKQIDDLLNEFKSKDEISSNRPVGHSDANLTLGDGDAGGDFDPSDANSTNIFISYLAPTVTEEQLYDLFSKYGPINSIKVMWPRSEEERLRKRNCGFVSYMKRRDAEDALMYLQGYEIDGYAMVMGWGKPVRVNNTPVSRAAVVGRSSYATSFHPVTNTFSSMVQAESDSIAIGRSKWDLPPSGVNAAAPQATSSSVIPPIDDSPCIQIQIPSSAAVRDTIDLLAQFVAGDGEQFEKVIRTREANNPIFRFLDNPESADGLYYRWKVYSLLMGDSIDNWRVEAFQLSVGGAFLKPPPLSITDAVPTSSQIIGALQDTMDPRYPHNNRPSNDTLRRQRADSLVSDAAAISTSGMVDTADEAFTRPNKRKHDSDIQDADREADRRRFAGMTGAQIERLRMQERRSRETDNMSPNEQEYQSLVRGSEELLSRKALKEWADTLNTISLHRTDIRRAMGFAFDHLDSAEEVASLLHDSLVDEKISPPHRIALLYLLSDVLHNASAPVKHASNYRTLLQYWLPDIFMSLGAMYRAIVGRMTAKQVEERVRNVFAAWSDWSVYPPLFLLGLEAVFFMTEAEAQRQRQFVEQTNSSDAQGSATDVDALRKRARSCGVVAYKESLISEMAVRVQYVETYAKTRLGISVDVQVVDNKAEHQMTTDRAREDSNTDRDLIGAEDDIDGEPINSDNIDGQPIADDDDIDGMVIADEDIDGVPMDENLDGFPIDEEEDIDGAPINIDES